MINIINENKSPQITSTEKTNHHKLRPFTRSSPSRVGVIREHIKFLYYTESPTGLAFIYCLITGSSYISRVVCLLHKYCLIISPEEKTIRSTIQFY